MAGDVLRLFREGGREASGRDAELGLLVREHEEAKATGRARFVTVRGPRGVGKSHLMQLFKTALGRLGVPIFEGGSGREVRRTWGVFSPMLTELLTFASRSGVPEAKVTELARSLERLRDGGKGSLPDERLVVFDAVTELLSLAGRGAPVFVFPDLDVADGASLELVRYVAAVASVPESRSGGLFVLTFRDEQALPSALSEVVTRVSGRTLALSGLDPDGIRAFLGRPEVIERLFAATGGNPEALGQLLERPTPALDFFVRRLERFGGEERAVLDVLALSPQALSVELLARTLEWDVATVATALDALVRERVATVRVTEGRPAWRLARDSDGQALVAVLNKERARGLTRSLAATLRQGGELLAASELLLALSPAEAVEVTLEAAAVLCDRGALEDAARLLEQVLPSVPGARRAQAAEQLGRTLGVLGRYSASARRLLEAARLGAPERRPSLVLDAAAMLVKRGRLARAEELLGFVQTDAVAARRALPIRAELCLLRGRPAEAVAQCNLALERSADDEQGVALVNVLGKALLVQGNLAEAEAAFADNARRAAALGLAQLEAMARLNEGVAAFKRGNRGRAVACWEATASGSRPAHAQAQANLGSLYAETGDFEPALEHLSRALQTFSRFAGAREVALAASNFARLLHFLGDLDRAMELSEHALERASSLGDAYLEAGAHLTIGAALIDRRRHSDAVHTLEQARSGFERVGNDGYAALAAALKARAHLLLGERAQAEVELDRRCVDKGSAQLFAAALEVELTRGELRLSLGDFHGAGRAAARAREALLSQPDLEAPIRLYHLMGRLRLAAGDVGGAQAEFTRAARMLDELLQRVPPVRRAAFLSVPRRAEVLAAVEPDLKLPRLLAAAEPRAVVERLHGLVGRSASLARILKQLEPVGRSNATVLVRGESGTGKELLADALHHLSPRRHMPLVKVNCAAMVEELLLSELFGHEKGAFTGAVRERKGRFELADGGTIFLDEIGDISPKAQVALLRVLQEREFDRVGGSRTLKVDVRVICATNRDLEALITQGRFRADLYYRLKGVMLELPPLRDRLEDLPLLAQAFLDRHALEKSEPSRRLSGDALALLARHSWPGNVRELENVVASASIFADGPIIDAAAFSHVNELQALLESARPPPPPSVLELDEEVALSEEEDDDPPGVSPPPSPSSSPAVDYYELARERGISLKELRHEVEMQCIRRALVESQGNISEAARLLRMKRSRLSQIVNAEASLREVARGN